MTFTSSLVVAGPNAVLHSTWIGSRSSDVSIIVFTIIAFIIIIVFIIIVFIIIMVSWNRHWSFHASRRSEIS